MTAFRHDHKDVQAIKALIQSFFDAINASDPKALGKHFFPGANLTIIRQEPPRAPSASHHPGYASLPLPQSSATDAPPSPASSEEKLQVVMRTTIEKFIALLEEGQKHRKPGGPVLHESPDSDATDVKIDGLFGNAWSPFKVTFDGVLHHYGVMVYTVGKADGEWRIEELTQSYRRTPGWEEKPPGAVL